MSFLKNRFLQKCMALFVIVTSWSYAMNTANGQTFTTLDDFSDGNFNSNPVWTAGSGTWQVASGVLQVAGSGGTYRISTPFTRVSNAWEFRFDLDGSGFTGQRIEYYFFMTSTSSNPSTASGYRVSYNIANTTADNTIRLERVTNGVGSTIVSYSNVSGDQNIRVTRENSLWTLYVGGVSRGTGSDATYTSQSCAYQGGLIFIPSTTFNYNHGFDNIRYAEFIPPTLNAQYNGEESKSICSGAAYTLTANPVGGSNCWMTSANWEYAWYAGTGSDATYWNGSTWTNTENYSASFATIANVAPSATTTYKVKVRCSADAASGVGQDATGVTVTVAQQSEAPTGLACYETATFNSTTCQWDITGTQPAAPTGLACYETATFNTTTCQWDVTGIHNPSLTYGSLTDIDGNLYKTIQIGTQNWMADNLKTTRYSNGELIPNIIDNNQWSGLTTGAYAYYENNTSNDCIYGKLYNWYAATDNRNVCPSGWHLPSNTEWKTLETTLGGASVAGGKMKSVGVQYWTSPNLGATNSSGFTGLPAGGRGKTGTFNGIGNGGTWWTTAELSPGSAFVSTVAFFYGVLGNSPNDKQAGFSIRCLQDKDTDSDGSPDHLDCAPQDATKWQTGNFYVDADGDGYGVGSLVSLCHGATTHAGYANQAGDCDDNNASVNPAATEVCNNIDDDCDGLVDEGVRPEQPAIACYETATFNTTTCQWDVTGSMLNPTLSYGTVSDIDGNVYKTIQIGTQNWMAENLKTTRYNNGDLIPEVTDFTEWKNLNSGAFSYYNNNPSNNCVYGKLYNWYAVTDQRKICPAGWHPPTDDEWIILMNHLGGEAVAGGKMKSTASQYWLAPNIGADNSSGLSLIPSGGRFVSYNGFNYQGFWSYSWSSNIVPFSTRNVWNLLVKVNSTDAGRSYDSKNNGIPLRCVKDAEQDNNPPTVITKNITVQLNTSGTVSITPEDIDSGSKDDNGLVTLDAVSPATFTCDDVKGSATTDLIISEYVEGISGNQAIEIFNGTGASVNLADQGYNLKFYFNGNTSAGTTIPLEGIIPNGGSFVVVNASADPSLLRVANQTNSSNWFDGDDAVALAKGNNNVDVIGQIGNDPGLHWGFGLNITFDRTLKRKFSVLAGDTDGNNSFNPSLQWDAAATDLGRHSVGNAVTLSVTDQRGNTDTGIGYVLVVDPIIPTITAPETVNVQADNGSCQVSGINLGMPQTTDNCQVTVTNNAPVNFPIGTTAVTWTVSDVDGNIATAIQQVIVSPADQPAVACYETATYNPSTCRWDVTGTQPEQPAIACYETATFNKTTCQWDVTGSPRLASIIISSDESKFSASSNTIDFNAPVPSSYSIIFKVSQIANGGSNPTYTWKRNGITVGTNSNTYTGTGWSNGETIQCILTSNATCVSGNPASSNTVSISVTLTNYFVVSDRKADRIFYYDADFNLVRSNLISSKKDVNAEDIWATSSDVYVLSGSEQRVYRINGSATTPSVSRKLRNTDGKNLKSLSGLAIIGNHLLVVEEKSEFIYRYNLDDAYNGTSNYNALQRIALNKDNKDAEALGYDAANNIIYVLDNDREKTIFRYPITSLTASRISVGNSTRSRKMKSQNGAGIKKALGLVVDQTFIRITDQGPDKAFTYRIADLFAGNNSVNLNALSANSLNGQNKYSTGISLFYSPVPLVSNISTPFVKKANNQYSIPPNTTSTIDLRVFSNPTPNQFGLQLISSDIQTWMTLRITDVNGRVVEVYDQLRSGQNLIIGSKYYQGIYFAELIQGNQRKVVRLMKLK